MPTGASPSPAEAPEPSEATRLLRAAADGDEAVSVRLFELLYDELRGLAGRVMAGEHEERTLQPTALVHEVWLRVFEPAAVRVGDRRHFLALAARAMRGVVVDAARARRRLKRGKDWKRVALEGVGELTEDSASTDLVELDAALNRLQDEAPRAAKVVELRYFGGLSVEETASALELSERTVAREWRYAKAWLSRSLTGE